MLGLTNELYNKKGLILLDAALIAETNMIDLTNNGVLDTRGDKMSFGDSLLGRDLNSQIYPYKPPHTARSDVRDALHLINTTSNVVYLPDLFRRY